MELEDVLGARCRAESIIGVTTVLMEEKTILCTASRITGSASLTARCVPTVRSAPSMQSLEKGRNIVINITSSKGMVFVRNKEIWPVWTDSKKEFLIRFYSSLL